MSIILRANQFLGICGFVIIFSGAVFAEKNEKTLIDFFQPFEANKPLSYEGIWGHDRVIPRDINNGLEDPRLANWCYWDGNIVKDDEGKYHMFASRWSQGLSHGKGWNTDSKGIHSVSDSLWGPYRDIGRVWPHWNDGFGANVICLRMLDGRYAVITSEVTAGEVFVSDNPYGPFEQLGEFEIDPNGFYPGWGRYNELDDGAVRAGTVGHLSNVMVILRPDNRYMMIARHCVTMISDGGILGPYKMYSDKAWLGVEGIPQFKMEDPTVWYSDGLYHIVVNFHGKDHTFHLTSEDGIHNWKNRGTAFTRKDEVFRHKDGTVEDWYTVQRPTVYVEDGLVKAFNFSVIDVHKGQDAANDENGSKIIVIPFDGMGFRDHMNHIVQEERKGIQQTPPPAPWQSTNIGSVASESFSGFDEIVNTIEIHSSGNGMEQDEDELRFVWQKMTGDVSATVLVMSHDVTSDSVESGLMIRKSLDEAAVSLFASVSKTDGFSLKERCEKGDSLRLMNALDISAPYWIRYVKRGNVITTYISSSNRKNWEEVGISEIDFGDEFYIGVAASSGNGNTISRARFKDLDVHPYGEPLSDGIIRHTFPDNIPASGVVEFEVEIDSVKALDIWVELQNVQTLEKYKVLRKRCWKSGVHKLTYESGVKLDPNATYWFVIKAVPMHFHDSEHVDSAFKRVSVK